MEDSFLASMNILDPSAQEFHPSSHFALPYPQFYYPYPLLTPPPPLPSHYVHPPQAADDDASSRAVVLSMVPTHVPKSAVTQAMMAFGGVRAVDTSYLMSEGIATVHFYDLRSAKVAVAEIREQHLRQQTRLQQFYGILPSENWAVQPLAKGGRGLIGGQAVWAQFAAKGLDVPNQGSLFVSVSDPAAVSLDDIREIFQSFGPLMAVREPLSKPHHILVDYFDVRDAARAQNELNGREVCGGVRVSVEFSGPCGSHSKSYQQRHHQSKRSGQQKFLLPPRLARTNSQASSGSGSGRDGNQEGVVVLKRNDARISNVSRNGNANNSASSSGRKNKGGNIVSNSSSSSSYPSSSSVSKPSPKQQHECKKNWKNHEKNSKKFEGPASASSSSSSNSRFEIKEVGGDHAAAAALCGSRDSRTTVMIKNIPNKYSQKLLLNMLDNHCILCNERILGENSEEPFSAYDFVYLPIDFNNKCNVGYGFVNLTSPEAAVRLYRAFHMQPWEVFNSRKICQVTYARLQGLEVLKEHFRNSKFACDNDEYMPVVFDPPRDGKEQLTEPLPIIGGRAGDLIHGIKMGITAVLGDLGCASSTTASTQAPSDHEAGDDDDDDNNGEEHDDSDRNSEVCGGTIDGGSDETAAGTVSASEISDELAASLRLLPSSSLFRVQD